MALPTTSETREFANFLDNGNGTTSRFVNIKSGLGTILTGVTFDAVSGAYPNATTEIFTYKSGGLGGTTVAVVTIVYTTPSKNFISTIVRT